MNGLAGSLQRNLRWIGWVAIVFLLQVASIFWVSDYSAARIKEPRPAPTLRMAGNDLGELLALRDPTLFALPHFRGFSGPAWLRPPSPPSRWFEWNEEPRWLAIAPETFPRANNAPEVKFDVFEMISASRPEPVSIIAAAPAHFRQKSEFKLTGGLSRRKVKLTPELPSWASTNLLTNTVIALTVNSEGLPVSTALLARSGLTEADDYALRTARDLRFESEANADNAGKSANYKMTWGEVTFQWHGKPMNKPSGP
jgi:hypothetical protein